MPEGLIDCFTTRCSNQEPANIDVGDQSYQVYRDGGVFSAVHLGTYIRSSGPYNSPEDAAKGLHNELRDLGLF